MKKEAEGGPEMLSKEVLVKNKRATRHAAYSTTAMVATSRSGNVMAVSGCER